jgi:hypothetical protein
MVRISKKMITHTAHRALARNIFCMLADIMFVSFLAAPVSGPFVGNAFFTPVSNRNTLADWQP